jgi:hypothetical protein
MILKLHERAHFVFKNGLISKEDSRGVLKITRIGDRGAAAFNCGTSLEEGPCT